MKYHISLFMTIVGIILIIAGCSEKEKIDLIHVADMNVPSSFNWQAVRPVEVSLEVITNTGLAVEGVIFSLYLSDPDTNGELLAKGVTGTDGKFETTLNVASYVKSVWAVGFMTTKELPILENTVTHTYGGVPRRRSDSEIIQPPVDRSWSYLPGITYNQEGVPSPMQNVPLEPDFLARIDATLPERLSVPDYHPHYMNPANQTNIKIDELAEVWITFVHEGAGFRNSLGFYTYDSQQVPQNVSDIGSRTIVLPNASLNNSGGGLFPGDTVYLGQFEPGVTIGWFLVANGFMQGSNVSTTRQAYYSNSHLNPEADPARQQHSILVYDDITERLLIGFEDLNRMHGSDDDFNDVVFFVSVSPVEAVDLSDVPPIDQPIDSDGDGISDMFDDYPDDPELAFNNFTYGLSGWGTLAFEDLWPSMGDYDFNDIVIDYNFNQITQAGNLVKKVEMFFVLRAVGAGFSNGFAVELPFASTNIYEIIPTHPERFEHETDGSLAVFRFFNSAFNLIPRPPSGFINTEPGSSYYEPVAFSVSFKLQSTVHINSILPTAPYNPFIFVNGDRSHEIHLPGYGPTSRVNMALFNTGDDSSAINGWYKTSGNLPWAVNIPNSWDYPVERAQISFAQYKFPPWAQTGGNSYPDWFKNKSGYRNHSLVFYRP